MRKIILLIILIVLFFKDVTPVLADFPTSGLVGHWKMDETDNNIVVIGTTIVDGVIGKARNFANQGYIQFPDTNLPQGTTNRTINLWFKTNDTTNKYRVLLHYGQETIGSTTNILMPNNTDDYSSFNSVAVSQWGNSFGSPTVVNDGKWHMATVIYNGSLWKLYLDGQLSNSKAMDTATILTGTGYFGRTPISGFNYTGAIDETDIWSRILSDDEILYLYNLPKLTKDGIIIKNINPTYRITTEQSLTITPLCISLEPSDTFIYNSTETTGWNTQIHTYNYKPSFYDGGTIKNITFSCTSALTGKTASVSSKIIIFRDYSKLIRYSGNPIIDIGSAWYNAYGVDAPYLHDYQQIGGRFYAPVQVNDVSMSPPNMFSFYNKIAVYTSPDLLNWQPINDNPIISNSPGSWDDHLLLHPSVIKIGNLWYLYYSALAPGVSIAQPYAAANWGPEQIGLATSPDFIHWTKYSGNPIYSGENPGNPHQSAGIPSVVQVGNKYYLYYHDRINNAFKYAVSSDGINWSYGGEILRPVYADWDDVSVLGNSTSGYLENNMDPFVFKNKKGFYEAVYTVNYSFTQNCGTALSEDGNTWYKHQGPILTASHIANSYDEYYVGDCVPVEHDNRFYLYYAAVPKVGYKGTNFDLGLGAVAYLEKPTINMDDYNLLINKGNFNIFDFNRLISNFGK